MMNITYQVKDAVYVNLTNRCPCDCVFCLRKTALESMALARFGWKGNLCLRK